MERCLVKYDRIDDIAIVSLDRAERHNALVPELLSDLLSVLRARQCREAAALILRAEGRSFSTGGDLLGFQQHRESIADYAFDLLGLLNRVILTMYESSAPIVCVAQGQVNGGALGLLLASDRVIMHPSASITPWYARVGFSPDGGWTAMLPRVIGVQQSMHWLATNARHDAETCLRLGLVHELVDACDTAALKWAECCANLSQASLVAARGLLYANAGKLGERLEAERVAFVRQVQTMDAQQGIDRFLGG